MLKTGSFACHIVNWRASAQEDFDAFLRMLRVMLATGQPGDADTIAASLMRVGGKRFADRCGAPSFSFRKRCNAGSTEA